MKQIAAFKCYFFVLIIFSGILYPQQLAVKSFGVEEGLVQSTVYSILQDHNGFLWFGTEGGLSKFDGIKFTNYTVTQGLPDNFITCMAEDKIGRLWLGTFSAGIVIFDGAKFKCLSTRDGLGSNSILSIKEDNNGVIWVGTENGGLNKYEKGKFFHYTTNDGLASNIIRTITQDKKGNLWFTSSSGGGGICKYDGKRFITFSKKDGLACDSVISFLEDSDGTFWLGTFSGISKFDGKNFYNFNQRGKIPSKVTSIYQDRKKVLWFTSFGDGLTKLENNQFTTYTIQNGLTSDIIQTVTQDRRGDLWIGTNNGGVIQLSAERFLSYTTKDGLPQNSIYAINEDKQGHIWLGTYGGGVCELINGKIKVYSIENGLPDNFISSIKTDNEGTVWFGSLFGISKFKNNKFTNYSTKDGLSDNQVFSIEVGRNNNIWIATNRGLSRLNNGHFTNYKTSDGLPDDKVLHIKETKDGALWIATLHGVSRYEGNKFYNLSSNDGLIDNAVFYICEDNDKNIWLGTQGGLSRLNGNKFINYTTENGLSDNQCFFLYHNGKDFYIGTSKGVNRINREQLLRGKEFNFKVYSARDGLPNSECSIGAVYCDSKGNLWFGTTKGVTLFNPLNKPELINPPIYLTNMKVFEKDISIKNGICLNYTQNNLKFDFLAVDFASPEKIIYKYILEGVDKSWNITAERSVAYPYLPPGKYRFKVIARNSDGVWSKQAAAIQFIIDPPFWMTYWFRAFMSVLVIGVIYSVYRYKTDQVKKRNIELTRLVGERTRELETEKNKSDDLLKNILPVSLVDELKSKGSVKPREFKSISIMFTDFVGFSNIAGVLPADKLVGELNDIFKSFDEIVQKYNLEKIKTIGDSYMVGSGLPEECDDHAISIIKAGLEMHALLEKRNSASRIKWEMRSGVHSGSVVAGVVGTKKFSYDIWGETVNIASRMESAGITGKINISASTYQLVKDYFECEYRGKISTKGIGELDMYLVNSEIKFTS